MYTADVHICLYCKYMHRRRSIINTWRESRSFVILHARGIAIRCTKRRLFFEEISKELGIYLLPLIALLMRFW